MGLTEWKGGVVLGYKLGDLSEKSGVGRYAIARIENAERGGRTTSVRVGAVNTSLFAARVLKWQRRIPILARFKADEHSKIQGHSD